VKTKQSRLESSAILRRPLVGPPSLEEREEEEEGVRETGWWEEKSEEWVWEDAIFEDTVPLVGLVRMILHSGKLVPLPDILSENLDKDRSKHINNHSCSKRTVTDSQCCNLEPTILEISL
jgi:hypothetical protein